MIKIILPKLHLEFEKWKFNKNYNLYVSNYGNFKDKTKEIINLKMSIDGYLQVPVCNNKEGTVKYLQAHRVVMETWCPQKDMWKKKLTVDHLDHNKRNNHYSNLEWVTREENLKRADNDLIYDDKDLAIQKLKNRIKVLENKLYNDITILIKKEPNNKGRIFSSWGDAKGYMVTRVPSLKNIKIEKMIKDVNYAITYNNNKYKGYYWYIKKGE